jgi:hypothetical protein
MSAALETLPSKADQACGACKKQKRRCDKSLPECSLCSRTGRPCTYGISPQQPPTAEEFSALQARLEGLEDRLSSSWRESSSNTSFSGAGFVADSDRAIASSGSPTLITSALFLDIDSYKWFGMQLPKPSVGIPMVGPLPSFEPLPLRALAPPAFRNQLKARKRTNSGDHLLKLNIWTI